MEELISAFANNSNNTYELAGSNLSSKGRFELIRSNDWVIPNQSDIEEPLLNTQDLFQQLREDLANLNWEPNIDYNDPFKSREARQNTIDNVIASGRALLGKPYLWGGKVDPDKGLDCSGYIHYIYKQNGIETPTYSGDFLKFGTEVTNIQQIMPGDIICTKGHVRMVSKIENGQIWCLEAKGKKYGVVEAPFKNFDSILSIRRVIDNQSPSKGKFDSASMFAQTLNATYRQILTEKGLDPDYSYILVAQDALESGYGGHIGGDFNYGGIKDTHKKGPLRQTTEYINGIQQPVYDNFRDFSSIEEYCKYKITLLSNSIYNSFNTVSADSPEEFVAHINNKGYSTTPTRLYVPRFMSVYKSVLTKI